jgi:ubiquinone/menaquinone biosynthesis C-methylase UbiE
MWKEQDRAAEDATAEIYDYLYNRTRFAQENYANFARTIANYATTAGDRALELACGTGTVTQLVRQLTKGKLTHYCIDHSPKMIEIAQRRCAHCYVADMEDLPFDDRYFDTLFVNSALHHFPSLEKVYSEAYRVLEHGGYFLIQEPNAHHIQKDALARALSFLFKKTAKKYPDVSGMEVKPSDHHAPITLGAIVEPLKAAGFHVASYEYRYYASYIFSALAHKIGRMLDKSYIRKRQDGYMNVVIARK